MKVQYKDFLFCVKDKDNENEDKDKEKEHKANGFK